MSKFYLPPSTTASTTTSHSPLTSPHSQPPQPTILSSLNQLPSSDSSYFPTTSSSLPTRPAAAAPYSAPSDSDEDDLPYPLPLPRAPFSDPNFSPSHYLSTLRNRHQTLEDLRTELRERVRDLGRELFDLVNDEYEDLMGVGTMLAGGEEKVEGVRVGVLGFQREVTGLRDGVGERRSTVEGLLRERRVLRGDIGFGRRLLDLGERVEELGARLGVEGFPLEEDEDEEDEEGERSTSDEDGGIARLRRNVELYVQLRGLVEIVGEEHPFVESQEGRMRAIREALLLDLGAALRSAKANDGDRGKLLKVVGLYRDVDGVAEAVRLLKAR